jgi:Protein kinase domain
MSNSKNTDFENIHQFRQRYIFTAQDEIGQGGFARIYKAYDKVRHRTVAIKRAESGKSSEFSLDKEFRLCNELKHNHIVSYENHYMFETTEGTYEYIVMPYYEQGNLEHVMQRNRLSDADRYTIIIGILNGLSYLHRQGFIHRDLKSENILMVRQGDVWIPVIADFGLSKLVSQDQSLIALSGSNVLSLSYATPEQVNHTKNIRKNIDLWPVGVLIYRMWAGELPFKASPHADRNTAYMEVTRKIIRGELPNKLNTLPEPYQNIVRCCLQTDPVQRVQSAEILLHMLGTNPVKAAAQPQYVVPDEDIPFAIIPTNDDETLYEIPTPFNPYWVITLGVKCGLMIAILFVAAQTIVIQGFNPLAHPLSDQFLIPDWLDSAVYASVGVTFLGVLRRLPPQQSILSSMMTFVLTSLIALGLFGATVFLSTNLNRNFKQKHWVAQKMQKTQGMTLAPSQTFASNLSKDSTNRAIHLSLPLEIEKVNQFLSVLSQEKTMIRPKIIHYWQIGGLEIGLLLLFLLIRKRFN